MFLNHVIDVKDKKNIIKIFNIGNVVQYIKIVNNGCLKVIKGIKGDYIMEGWYKHYKGGIYYVDGVVIHSETLQQMVLYHSQDKPNLQWVRPHSMFFEDVITENDEIVQRFKKI